MPSNVGECIYRIGVYNGVEMAAEVGVSWSLTQALKDAPTWALWRHFSNLSIEVIALCELHHFRLQVWTCSSKDGSLALVFWVQKFIYFCMCLFTFLSMSYPSLQGRELKDAHTVFPPFLSSQ